MIKVNGKPVEDAEGLTLSDYLTQAGYTPDFVAVEKDGAIVPRAQYAHTVLCAGDKIEIVQFVGGG
ncbi:MAG: sulfur carrier protein ThiS [Butyricicoccus pullicaecorum]|nr:sulfur carrier protein ThiS [Butyricicoccus pullicaecorum]